MKQEIEFTIDEEGNVEFDIAGMKGKGCMDVANELAKALGTKVKSVQKAEYHQQNVQEKQKVNIRQGF